MEYVYYPSEVLAEHAVLHLRKIWLTWEKLRILYNYILFSEGVTWLLFLRLLGAITGQGSYLYGPYLWQSVFIIGLFANLFYFLGPLMELLVCVVAGHRAERLRPYLFMAGLFFSMFLIFCIGVRMWRGMVG